MRRTRRFLAFTATSLAAVTLCTGFLGLPPRTLKTKVGPPVVEALMGGCSLRCAFPWEVAAGTPPKPIYATNDIDARTAWIDDHPGGSVGTKLAFHFQFPTEMNGTPFYGLQFIDGAWTPDDGGHGAGTHWRHYARIKKLRLAFNGKPLFDIALADTNRWQSVFFDDILLASGDTMTLEILEVYPGTATQDVALSEIVLQGAH